MKQFFLTVLGVFTGLILFVVVIPVVLLTVAVASSSLAAPVTVGDRATVGAGGSPAAAVAAPHCYPPFDGHAPAAVQLAAMHAKELDRAAAAVGAAEEEREQAVTALHVGGEGVVGLVAHPGGATSSVDARLLQHSSEWSKRDVAWWGGSGDANRRTPRSWSRRGTR